MAGISCSRRGPALDVREAEDSVGESREWPGSRAFGEEGNSRPWADRSGPEPRETGGPTGSSHLCRRPGRGRVPRATTTGGLGPKPSGTTPDPRSWGPGAFQFSEPRESRRQPSADRVTIILPPSRQFGSFGQGKAFPQGTLCAG